MKQIEKRSPEGLVRPRRGPDAAQIKHVFRIARGRERHADRAESVFALSVGLGLRAKELASLKWGDVYEADGEVRPLVHLKAAYTKGAKTRDVFVSSPRCGGSWRTTARSTGCMAEGSQAPLFRSQKGGHMTASSMARFLKASIARLASRASPRHGRRTLITGLAERGIDLKAIAEIAGTPASARRRCMSETNPTRLARILQDVSW